MLPEHKVWAEIDLAALRSNYRALTALIPSGGCRPFSVVKADAYGHGADACTGALLDEGCRGFAVSGIEEALAVRAVCHRRGADDADILILGYTPPDETAQLIGNNIIQACFSPAYAEKLSSAAVKSGGKPLRVHLKLDTGMNRIGFPAHCADEISGSLSDIIAVSRLPGLAVCGAFSHFAVADTDGTGDPRTREQYERFRALTDAVIAAGIPLPVRHICNSAATLRFPEYHMDACRLGIMLYGAEPSDCIGFPLRPVMKLKTVIAQLHTLRAGESLSYGGTYTADADMPVATIPVGYADGFIRAYSGCRAVIHSPDGTPRGEGHVIGCICMDQCMLDVRGTDAREGDIVTLIGEEGQLEELAARAGTIGYECLCLISARVARVTVQS